MRPASVLGSSLLCNGSSFACARVCVEYQPVGTSRPRGCWGGCVSSSFSTRSNFLFTSTTIIFPSPLVPVGGEICCTMVTRAASPKVFHKHTHLHTLRANIYVSIHHPRTDHIYLCRGRYLICGVCAQTLSGTNRHAANYKTHLHTHHTHSPRGLINKPYY